MPDTQDVTETEGSTAVYFDHWGYGRIHPQEQRQIATSGAHLRDAGQPAWLNDTVTAGAGEARVKKKVT